MSVTLKNLAFLKRLPSDVVVDKMDSPIGKLTILASDKGLHALLWERDWKVRETSIILKKIAHNPNHKYIKQTKKQLEQYFSGKRKDFDIPLVVDGTDFQQSAWRVLRKIPYGKTISYQDQAIKLGDKNKVRAVGGANGRNPHSIIVPCHRVISKSGDLCGFGGGLKTKDYLLKLEQSHL